MCIFYKTLLLLLLSLLFNIIIINFISKKIQIIKKFDFLNNRLARSPTKVKDRFLSAIEENLTNFIAGLSSCLFAFIFVYSIIIGLLLYYIHKIFI